MLRLTSALFAGLVALSGPAAAAVYSFDFSVPNSQSSGYDVSSLPPSKTFTSGDLSLTLGAMSIEGGSVQDGRLAGTDRGGYIGFYPGGAGIVNSRTDNSHTVDGSGWKDIVTLSFDRNVTLKGLSFGYFVGQDDFWVGWDDGGDGSFDVGDRMSSSFDIPGSGRIAFSVSPTVSVFAVAAMGSDDSWKLRGVTVDADPSAVPIPAAGLLALAGLGSLGALRRFRKA